MSLHRESRTMATTIIAFLLTLFLAKSHSIEILADSPIPQSDVDLIQFALNLEFLEAEFFLNGASGIGLDQVAPNLTNGGPPPIGARKANLDPLILDVITQLGLQEVGHLRFLMSCVIF